MLLYILHFNNKNYFKIGVTNNILRRVRQIHDNFNLGIDLHNTIIVTNAKQSRIKRLERNLLDITSDFQYKFPEHLNNCPGRYEFRTLNCQNLIKQFILEQKNYKLNYQVYEGLDLCGHYDITIPKAYYPIDTRYTLLSDLLQQDLDNYCEANKLSIRDFYNELLYKKACELGIERPETNVDYKGYYQYEGK
ncbi:hypothetical protein MED134_08496 [Dokdonia sp. MED134]|uniref:GIY-YIG nuclease family protein n=1 Tax=Dokdonia sp. MED134 TaxID=313590 RepID=UPI000068D047|nr:GIY-YIG nuclease family protein [Dokdonia sp. MED134]EAQ39516.3 hypothetical protein MED134_08496 [Dokdonia sp. MED134]